MSEQYALESDPIIPKVQWTAGVFITCHITGWTFMATETERRLPALITGSQIVYCMAFTRVMEMTSGPSTQSLL